MGEELAAAGGVQRDGAGLRQMATRQPPQFAVQQRVEAVAGAVFAGRGALQQLGDLSRASF